MHSVQSDNSLLKWAVAGAAPSILHAGTVDASDQLLELIDKYQIYSRMSPTWFRLENAEVWFGQTICLCGTHKIEWPGFDRVAGCENLTHLLHMVAGSMIPLERNTCRHEIGSCRTRLIEASTGTVCHHSLALDMSHPFSAVGSHRHSTHHCLEQLESRLRLLGVPRVGGDGETLR